MNISLRQPTEGVREDNVAIVLFNHLGSSNTQDTGRDAQFFADDLGVTVMAVDRPGTHGIIPSRRLASDLSTPSGYLDRISSLSDQINMRLDALGVERSLITGRSAAGVGVSALTASGLVETQEAMFVAEPISCQQLDLDEAKRRFKEYGSEQKKLQDENPEILIPEGDQLSFGKRISRLGHMVFDFYFEQFHNQYIYASNASVGYMRQIAEHQPDINVVVEFAEHSLVANSEVYAEVKSLEAERTGGSPFIVRQSSNTTHASYDDRKYMSSIISPVLDQAMQA